MNLSMYGPSCFKNINVYGIGAAMLVAVSLRHLS